MRPGRAKVRSRAGWWGLDGEDHNSGYQMDTVTATELWDRIGACPIPTIIERMHLDKEKTQVKSGSESISDNPTNIIRALTT